MPVLSTLRGRESTQQQKPQRSWGTRYDSLVTSPVLSQAIGAVSSDGESEAATSLLDREDDGGKKVDDLFEEDSSKTSWADDEVPETLAGSPTQSATASPSYTASRVKMPHNASVFIGSLPTNMGETELKHALLDHLSQFANVHKIKLIHDHQKGCVSAFVQCKDADQATQLIAKSPKPFQGRMLRFETARAHRSLYLSYKKPRTFVPSSDVDRLSNETEDENPGRWIERELHENMRIHLPQGSKCAIVQYNIEALEKAGQSPTQRPSLGVTLDQLGDEGILFPKLEYDEKSMHELAASFGPLEYFQPYFPPADAPSIPPGHGAARSPRMDERVWEVKWEHRDDCIIALNTLKTIPHICASWTAQRPTSKGWTPTSPTSFASRIHPGIERSPRLHPTEGYSQESSPDYRILKSPRHEPPSATSDVDFPSLNSSAPSKATPAKEDLPVSERLLVLGLDESDHAYESRAMATIDSAQTLTSESNVENFDDACEEDALKAARKNVQWNASDRLVAEKDETLNCHDTSTIENDTRLVEMDISSNPDDEASDGRGHAARRAEICIPPARTRPAIFHRRSLSNPAPRIDTTVAASCGVPTTPELSGATYSPESTLSAIPHTPLYSHPGLPSTGCKGNEDIASDNFGDDDGNKSHHSHYLPSPSRASHERDGLHREIDPKTIFVGGLESTGAEDWDDQRLRAIFGKYGTIVHVKYVRQNPKKAAFAFVTFSDESAPPKAIAAEHNRMYGGRAIRVQIRDIFPARSFKYRPRVNQRPRFGVNGQYVDFGLKSDRSSNSPFNTYGRDPSFDRAFPPGFPSDRRFFPFSNDRGTQARVPPFVVIPRLVSQRQSSIADSESFPSSQSISDSVHSTESDARTAVSITPPPSVSNVSMSATAVVPVTPQGARPSPVAYYHPQPWPSPYGPAMFPLPVGAYGPFMPQVPVQYAPLPNASAQINQPFQWAPPTIPYQYVPVLPAETPRSTVASAPETPVKSQAPLSATGFVQGEHGGLIPIYQQEALNQYMASANNSLPSLASSSSSNASACTSPVGPPGRPLGISHSQGSFWTGGPTQASLYAFPPPSIASSGGLPSSQSSVANHMHVQTLGSVSTNGQPWRQIGVAMPNH